MISQNHMKTVKFMPHLAEMVLAGDKTSTWRLFDDKDLSVGDELSLVNKETLEGFAKAKIIKVEEKKLKDLKDEDFVGHERFESEEQMYQTYRSYYGDKVGPDTIVKMIDFELV